MSAYTGQRTNRGKKNIQKDLSPEQRIDKAQSSRSSLERHLRILGEMFPKSDNIKRWLAFCRQIKHGLNAIDSQYSIELYKDLLKDDSQETLEGAES